MRFLDGLGTALKDGDDVSIVPAVAGGGKPARRGLQRTRAGTLRPVP